MSHEEGSPAPTAGKRCAQCHISLEWASLLLACDHNLCLPCAAQSLKRDSSGPVVQCRLCHDVTSVDDSAAKYLEELRPEWAKGSGGTGGGPAVAASASSDDAALQAEISQNTPRAIASPSSLPPPRPASPNPQGSAADDVLGGYKGLSVSASGASTAASSRSAAAAQQLQAQSLPRCGQCEEATAELYCEQCQEVFCRGCGNATHRRGKMAQHRLRPTAEARPVAVSVASPAVSSTGGAFSSWAAGASPDTLAPGTSAVGSTPPPLLPLPRRFLRCPVHTEEPLQFFCLRCETFCICAECALHGVHRGHDVLNVREAVKQLPEKISDLTSAAQARSEELLSIAEHAKDGSREIASICSGGRRELRSAIEKLRVALREEEQALLVEVDRCSADVTGILSIEDHPSEARVRDSHASLTKYHQAADAAMALNWFSKAKKAQAEPPPSRPDLGSELHTQLRGQLQRGFEARLQGVQAVSSQLTDLTQLRLQGVEVPSSARALSSRGATPPRGNTPGGASRPGSAAAAAAVGPRRAPYSNGVLPGPTHSATAARVAPANFADGGAMPPGVETPSREPVAAGRLHAVLS
eukprot:TRINITY_DN7924_c0_g1_i1.p1 TRINITY_DN7924_c0_g1~~TRINITY_DN7924_c0_g1_i1.p1  ORF type:complete len:584 (-),score=108.99 TRINITY_DN7924_c0_g1_i1:247-1998(-)